MDWVAVIGLALMFTFVTMIATGAMAMGSQRPPLYRRVVPCPEDEERAIVALSWNPKQRRTVVVKCESHQWNNGSCGKSCEQSLQGVFPEPIATTVVP